MRVDQVARHLGKVESGTRGAADIWSAEVGEHVGALDRYSAELLSRSERERLQSYRSRAAAERYVLTRALVRLVLAERLDMAPAAVPVGRTDAGKPIVTGGVHFNVSHSGDLILLAVSGDRDLGVDIERQRDVARVSALIARWLTPVERAEVARLVEQGATTSGAFLRVWSFKEARLKALGVGISGQGRATAELERIEVSSLDALLESVRGSDGAAAYVGALAFA